MRLPQLITLFVFIALYAFGIKANAAACQSGINYGSQSWDGYRYGDSPTICFLQDEDRCLAVTQVVTCFPSDGRCNGVFTSNGRPCPSGMSLNQPVFGGSVPERPDDGSDGGSDGGGSDGGSDGGGSDGGGSDDGSDGRPPHRLPNAPAVGPVIINRNGTSNLTNAVQSVVNANRVGAKYIERAIYDQTGNLIRVAADGNNLQKTVISNQNSLRNLISTALHGLSSNSNDQTQQLISVRDTLRNLQIQDKAFQDAMLAYQKDIDSSTKISRDANFQTRHILQGIQSTLNDIANGGNNGGGDNNYGGGISRDDLITVVSAIEHFLNNQTYSITQSNYDAQQSNDGYLSSILEHLQNSSGDDDDVGGDGGGSDGGSGGSGGVTVNIDTKKIESSLSEIKSALTADSSQLGACQGEKCPEGYYRSNYENGFRGIFEANFENTKSIALAGVTDIFGKIDISNAAAPNLCLNLYMYGSFCFTDYVNFDWIFAFIRAAFMFTTFMLCRKLVVGG